jgi:hypothetical protein
LYLEPIDQLKKGESRIITDLSEKENFNKLLNLYLSQVQEIEVANIELSQQKNINTAEGIWLDYIGGIVGEKRKGKLDSEYRGALFTRIGINSADATPDTLINLIKSHTSADHSRIIQYFPAAFFVTTEGQTNLDSSLFYLVENTRPVGVRAHVVSNILGDRLTPAWLLNEPAETSEFDFVLDNGDLLLLDATSPPTDTLIIVSTPEASYYKDSLKSAIPSWGDEDPINRRLAQLILAHTTQLETAAAAFVLDNEDLLLLDAGSSAEDTFDVSILV